MSPGRGKEGEEMGMEEKVKIRRGESLGEAMERAERKMKERLWREVWRDLVELEGVEYDVDGHFIIVRYEDKV